jgi:predicted nucleic acid-binding protein
MYFDTAYLGKLYLEEPDAPPVRMLAAESSEIVCGAHGRVELAFLLHRKLREGVIDSVDLAARWKQVETDSASGLLRWLPLDAPQIESAAKSALTLPASLFLRSADALHLATARDHGFKTIYSNDKNLLAAAKHFGLRGKNVIK